MAATELTANRWCLTNTFMSSGDSHRRFYLFIGAMPSIRAGHAWKIGDGLDISRWTETLCMTCFWIALCHLHVCMSFALAHSFLLVLSDSKLKINKSLGDTARSFKANQLQVYSYRHKTHNSPRLDFSTSGNNQLKNSTTVISRPFHSPYERV